MAGPYYVSGIVGSDANNGLGPDASDASDKPFLTLDKALSTVAAGEIIYVGPGINRPSSNATNTVDTTGAAGASIIYILGDPLNIQGFKTAAGVLLPAAPALVTVYAADTAGSAFIALAANDKSYYTCEDVWFEGGSYACFIQGTSTHWTFNRCMFSSGDANGYLIYFSPDADLITAHSIDRCVFIGEANIGVYFELLASYTADADLATTVTNCLGIGLARLCSFVWTSGHSFNAGGVTISNCTSIGATYGVYGNNPVAAATHKIEAYNNLLVANNGVYRTGTGDNDWCTEDYNMIVSVTPRTGTAVGANSIALDGANLGVTRFACGLESVWGLAARPIGWPTMDCPHWDMGSTSYGGTTDLLGRPSPSGTGAITKPAGCYANHDYGVKETTVKDAGDASIKLTGPGDQEIRIPVDASATTIAIKARFDSGTYGGTNYPQAILLDATEIGVSTETETATIAASDAWETLTFTEFTPTAKGWVTIRLLNRGSGGDDICYFDTIAVT